MVVADADPEKRPTLRNDMLVDWPVDHPGPRRVAFVRSEKDMPPSLRDLWAAELVSQQREEINGLYVAMTRAREWLVFSRTEPYAREPEVRPWWARIEQHAQAWELQALDQVSKASAASTASTTTPETTRIPVLPHAPAALSPIARPSVADDLAARRGQALHRLLEWATGPMAGRVRSQWTDAGQAAALAFGLAAEHGHGLAKLAAAVLSSPACKLFFDAAALQWAGNEVPVVWQGQVLRIDRLVALKPTADAAPEWWVLDYKLTTDPLAVPGYRQQMAQYIQAVQLLQPGAAVRAAFITGQGELVEL